jgi:hypothetical protein
MIVIVIVTMIEMEIVIMMIVIAIRKGEIEFVRPVIVKRERERIVAEDNVEVIYLYLPREENEDVEIHLPSLIEIKIVIIIDVVVRKVVEAVCIIGRERENEIEKKGERRTERVVTSLTFAEIVVVMIEEMERIIVVEEKVEM